MRNHLSQKPLIIALGAAFALTGAVAHAGAPQGSVFQATPMSSGYTVADNTTATTPKAGEQKCGEKGSNCGKGAKAGECVCGADKGKKADGKCGEGKCGANKKK
jgi:uncharacterized low-complexity protein